MGNTEQRLQKELEKRKAENAFRTLPETHNCVDFSSNDYLGLASSGTFQEKVAGKISNIKGPVTGSTGSRLLTGNYPLITQAEEQIARFHKAPAGLIFNSGYNANSGLLSTVPKRSDTIFFDELSHASIRDGARLSHARACAFKHNDPGDLKNKLKQSRGTPFIVVESLYSMDGDLAPLEELAGISAGSGSRLIVDEAHATGIFGKHGEGLVNHLGLENKVFARIHTFGKALGCHGAIVLGSKILIDYLVNFSRPFIYTTALSPHTAIAVKCAYDTFPSMYNERKHILSLSRKLKTPWKSWEGVSYNSNDSPVNVLIIPGNDRIKQLTGELQKEGLDIRPILFPTVPKGKERVRICLHAFNTAGQAELINRVTGNFLMKNNG